MDVIRGAADATKAPHLDLQRRLTTNPRCYVPAFPVGAAGTSVASFVLANVHSQSRGRESTEGNEERKEGFNRCHCYLSMESCSLDLGRKLHGTDEMSNTTYGEEEGESSGFIVSFFFSSFFNFTKSN